MTGDDWRERQLRAAALSLMRQGLSSHTLIRPSERPSEVVTIITLTKSGSRAQEDEIAPNRRPELHPTLKKRIHSDEVNIWVWLNILVT